MEFALILPILLLLVLGIINFGIIFNAFITITSAAREAARAAVVADHTSQYALIETAVVSNTTFLLIENFDVTISPENNPPLLGDELTATATGTVRVIVPLLNVITGEQYELESSSTMRIEKTPGTS